MSPSLESAKQAQALLAIENSCNEASNAIVNAFGLQEANSHGVSASTNQMQWKLHLNHQTSKLTELLSMS